MIDGRPRRCRFSDSVSGYVRALDDHSMMRFDNVEALRQLEAIDVENGEYEAWDSAGRVLRLRAAGITRFNPGTIKVKVTDELVSDELKAKS